MLKALLIGGLIAISTAATLYSSDNSAKDNVVEGGCLYETELWGSEDGTKFYFCLPGTDTAIEQECARDTFFVRNATTCGCVPLDLVNPHCVGTTDAVGPCTGTNLQQPQPASNPAQYYLCPAVNATPVLLTRPTGKAFIKQNGYLGCFEWSQWRSMRQCPEENDG